MGVNYKQKLQEALNKSKERKQQQNQPTKQSESNVSVQLTKKNKGKITKVNTKPSQLSTLQEKMKKKLTGSKFRWLNETLYTNHSKHAIKIFQEQPELFDIYHEGFSSQVQDWPENPVDIFIDYLENVPKESVVVDMGCGEAKIAATLHEKLTIHSFDLVAANEFITACDISKVPLKSKTVNIVIFCLSLMGVNFVDFLKEAHRILRKGGELKIAEVISRIDNLKEFIKGVESIGFKLVSQNKENKMFVLLDFHKVEDRSPSETEKVVPALKPCLYKKR
ncbi:methyltransferase-domain-containing protein [Globomyces pollinis-pini]|nr:methyltransferase-domain-containing protein [Globomyces pollinis-pini]